MHARCIPIIAYKQLNSHDGYVDQLIEGERGDFRESHVTEPPVRIIEVVNFACNKINRSKEKNKISTQGKSYSSYAFLYSRYHLRVKGVRQTGRQTETEAALLTVSSRTPAPPRRPAECLCCTGRCARRSGRWPDSSARSRSAQRGRRSARAGARPPGEPCACDTGTQHGMNETRTLREGNRRQRARKLLWKLLLRSLKVSSSRAHRAGFSGFRGSPPVAFRCCRNCEGEVEQAESFLSLVVSFVFFPFLGQLSCKICDVLVGGEHKSCWGCAQFTLPIFYNNKPSIYCGPCQ